MLEDGIVTEHTPVLVRGLLDNAGIGNDHDDTAQAPAERMAQRETQRRERLPSARGDGQAEDTLLGLGRCQALLVDLTSGSVEVGVGGRRQQRPLMLLENAPEFGQLWCAPARFSAPRGRSGPGVEVVGVHQRERACG